MSNLFEKHKIIGNGHEKLVHRGYQSRQDMAGH